MDQDFIGRNRELNLLTRLNERKGAQFLILYGRRRVGKTHLIQRTALDYHAPLYGRATARLKLQPLPFGALSQFLPNMSTEQRVAIYALAGGIPAYIKQFDDSLTIRDNLYECLISPANIMLNYAYFTRLALTIPAQERANEVDALQISPAVIEQDILRWMEQS